jgi:hypothetical protein
MTFADAGPMSLYPQHVHSCSLQSAQQSQRHRRRRHLMITLQPHAAAMHIEQHPTKGQPPQSGQPVQPNPSATGSHKLCARVLAKHTWLQRLQCRASIADSQRHDGEVN